MNTINEILSGFESISLSEVAGASLMDRSEIKYAFNLDQLPDFLKQVINDYRVLEVNHSRLNPYETLYFDTQRYLCYFQHHNSVSNRYKIRQRHYTASGDCFFEIKYKNNKNKVIKNRIATKCIKNNLNEENLCYLKDHTSIEFPKLYPKLWVYFSRITLVNKKINERLTIDVNVTFKKGDKIISYPKIVIVEIKQDHFSRTPFMMMLKRNHVRTESVSKYCLGLISTNANFKMNNFKHKLMIFKKLNYEK